MSYVLNVSRIYLPYLTYKLLSSTVNIGLTVSEKSVFPTTFGQSSFQRNLFSFGKHMWLHKVLFYVICLQIPHNGVTFFLTAVDEN